MGETPFDEEIEVWKKKYISYGIPETVLDRMIEEAELEWNTEIGYRDINIFYALRINIIDSDLMENEYYFVAVSLNDEIIRGKITTDTSVLFSTLPADTLVVRVLRMKKDAEVYMKGYGECEVTLSSDKDVNVYVSMTALRYGNLSISPFWKVSNLLTQSPLSTEPISILEEAVLTGIVEQIDLPPINEAVAVTKETEVRVTAVEISLSPINEAVAISKEATLTETVKQISLPPINQSVVITKEAVLTANSKQINLTEFPSITAEVELT